MRLLVDVESLEWTEAWNVTTRVFSVTIHSVLPEMLEKWPIELLQALLPRHIQVTATTTASIYILPVLSASLLRHFIVESVLHARTVCLSYVI